ncbi:MAG: hypothetical protein J6S23_01525 [Clostridia bacterium]|nr:hypothetical protein [Clostridia bacterium]
MENGLSISDKRRTSNKVLEICKEAERRGISPCEICEHTADPTKCGGVSCYPWYVWFTKEWRNIREAARRKGYRV